MVGCRRTVPTLPIFLLFFPPMISNIWSIRNFQCSNCNVLFSFDLILLYTCISKWGMMSPFYLSKTVLLKHVSYTNVQQRHQKYKSQSIKMLVNNQTKTKCPPRYNWNIVESGVKHHKPTIKQNVYIKTLKDIRLGILNVVAAGPTKAVNFDKFRS